MDVLITPTITQMMLCTCPLNSVVIILNYEFTRKNISDNHNTESECRYTKENCINMIVVWNYENDHVMTCIGNRVNATFIPNNFLPCLIAVEIMIFPPIYVKTIWI